MAVCDAADIAHEYNNTLYQEKITGHQAENAGC